MRWSDSDLRAYEARRNQQPTANGGVDDESELHRAIIDECQRRGWIVFHGSMAHRTYRTPGEPDFIILADGGATLLVEAKTRKGKLSTDQLGIQAWARKLDHTIHVIRSMEEFLKVANP
jgi:predicted RecB family nuclease